ncbi:hypothetical protein [Melittangium boletus]|uniref:Lipoprotein n=1 Tax=Melittangium boletus DSM 14713 TaxID=1294270 RepID=A0A250IE97_9BACT|nr:hypothetical protein [Melittangium boletus]ATB30159.1 lipoprotein [Melittangium boletus DSM 14713]
MKKQLLSAVVLCALGLVGCGVEDPPTTPTPTNPNDGPKYNTQAKINAALAGKTLVMTGADIPSFPNGYDEDINYGQATQCYQSVTMTVEGEQLYKVTSVLGTLLNAPKVGDKGECDHDAVLTQLEFTSTAVLLENVKADGSCFDVTYTFPGGVVQEGRGQVSQDGKTLKLELFFVNQATGHRCADGAVGASTVILKGAPFTGNAVQTYTIQ